MLLRACYFLLNNYPSIFTSQPVPTWHTYTKVSLCIDRPSSHCGCPVLSLCSRRAVRPPIPTSAPPPLGLQPAQKTLWWPPHVVKTKNTFHCKYTNMLYMKVSTLIHTNPQSPDKVTGSCVLKDVSQASGGLYTYNSAEQPLFVFRRLRFQRHDNCVSDGVAQAGVSVNVPQFSVPPIMGVSQVSVMNLSPEAPGSHPLERRRTVILPDECRESLYSRFREGGLFELLLLYLSSMWVQQSQSAASQKTSAGPVGCVGDFMCLYKPAKLVSGA